MAVKRVGQGTDGLGNVRATALNAVRTIDTKIDTNQLLADCDGLWTKVMD